MSHRPLDILRKEARAADRAPHLRRKQMPMTDTIDALDTIGGTYHHGGPYDATLASRNQNKKYSPVAAVEESNREALRATPRANIQDSLNKKMPLQGTADIPSGERDFTGDTINYEEGADLMRERDAQGGAYKRWDDIVSVLNMTSSGFSLTFNSNTTLMTSRARENLLTHTRRISRRRSVFNEVNPMNTSSLPTLAAAASARELATTEASATTPEQPPNTQTVPTSVATTLRVATS